MFLRRLLNKIGLRYNDMLEEQEYLEIRTPLLKQFFNCLFVCVTGILIAYSVRYFTKNIFPQNYIIVALIIFAVFLFLITHKIGKCFDWFLLAYLCLIIALFTTVFRQLITDVNDREAFYMGYAFAMIHRLVGYGVIEFSSMVVLYVVSISVKFPLINNPDVLLNIIVVVLDLLTVFLSYKGEKMERSLFDASYKAKKDVLKFKNLLTQYLPNQMAIFNCEYTNVLYINNAFKRTFKCKDSSLAKEALGKFLIEKETIDKQRVLFSSLGVKMDSEQSTMSLSHFMKLLAQNNDLLRDIGNITIPVVEDEAHMNLPKETRENILDIHESNEAMKKNEIPVKKERDNSRSHSLRRSRRNNQREDDFRTINLNESCGSSDRGSSITGLSDLGYEEGRKRVFKVKIFPLFWDDTEAIAMVMDDITQQRIIMELKVADKNKDLVIAMVSHELRTPLNGILGMLEIAKKNIEDQATITYLDACKNSGILMLNLVNSILDMQQIRENKLKLIYTKINLTSLFKELNNLFEHCCQIKKLYLDFKMSPNTPRSIISDKNRLNQILINLLGNAVKFTFTGGITVRVGPEDSDPNRIRFSVCDTGIGISQEDQERLFKLYGKLEQQNKKINTQGVGLGLTISNTLAFLLNPIGKKPIEIDSEVGKGTCFSFVVESQELAPHERQRVESFTLDEISYNMLNEGKEGGKEGTMTEKINAYTLVKSENFSRNIGQSHSLGKQLEEEKEKGDLKYHCVSLGKDIDEKAATKAESNEIKDSHTMENVKLISQPNENVSLNLLNKFTLLKQKEEDQNWCLIVDDNPFNLMVASHIMKERGYLVKNALNGQEAIERAIEHQKNGLRFELALMDCQMPVMDGYEATNILKTMMKEGEIKEYPIIALTANNRNEVHDKLCKEVGMDGHVAKPLQLGELEEVLKEVEKKKK